ncbi:MAG TPA: ribonuclease HI [Candidatus Avichristensenella intestinipullorum]|uniref:Ribonuclease H n=1 Tax=Candidatus Avichristensenella intestinipullorum TaxID=2840693 RepID=A0A9D1CJA3_9FIRM|nr:ribonuclease HI [Candidatus Avichristensenella intestinipullorum]
MKEVTIYTDGACSGNPGPGGWAAVLRYGEHVKEMSGFMPQTTNNRMEIMAAIQGLGALKQPCSVTLCSDSAYLVNAFEKGWIQNWQRNGWKNAAKEPVENQDLWTILLMTIRRHGHVVRFTKVPGHADDADNNRCDALARAAIRENQKASAGDETQPAEENPPAAGRGTAGRPKRFYPVKS